MRRGEDGGRVERKGRKEVGLKKGGWKDGWKGKMNGEETGQR